MYTGFSCAFALSIAPMVALCVGSFVGCAGSLDDSWDNPTASSLRERFRDADRWAMNHPEQAGANHAESAEIRDALSDGLSVKDAIRVAIVNSPQLRLAGYRVDAASGRVTQAGLYPNPSFVFEAEALGSDAGEAGETAYLLEQEIVLGGKLRRARDVAEADRLAAQASFVAEEFTVASRVTRAYFTAASAEERLARRQEIATLSEQLFTAASAQVDAGAATEPDRLRAELVRDKAQIELAAATLEVDAARRALASTLGVGGIVEASLVSPLGVLPALPLREELMARVLETNGRMSLARIAIDRARRAHQLAKAQAVPNLTASIGPRYSDPDDETTLDVGVGIEIPIFNRNQGEISAMLAERLAAGAELRSVQLDLLAEVSRIWSVYEAARIAVTRYREQILPKAARTLDLTQEAYRSGKADYLRLLDAQQVVVESQITYVDALQRLHESAALLRELAQTHAPWRDPRIEDHAHTPNHKEETP